MGTYRIIRRLAVDPVAELFLARSVGAKGLESLVLLERLLPEPGRDGTFVERFLDSARTSATRANAQVVRVLDSGLSGERPCRVLEFVDGEPLEALLAAWARPLGLRELCFIVLQVAEGLSSLQGFHPSQVWVSRSGEVRLLARGGVFRSGGPVEARGDVFHLGLLLYALLAGRPLHSIGALDERGLEPLPGCPPSLWAVLLRALAAEPEVRFRSARALADTLRGFLEERQLGVDHLDLARLFARAFPTRCSPLEVEEMGAGEELTLTARPPPRPAAMPRIIRRAPPERGLPMESPPVLYPVVPPPPPPPDDALEETPEEVPARLLDEALRLAGGGAEVAPLLVRLTRGCVARLGGGSGEESLAVLAARTLVLAARLEEPRRFVLPSFARVRPLVEGCPELGELLSDVLLAGGGSGPPAGCAASALLCASAFVAQVQSARPEEEESARVLGLLRRDSRLVPAALEALSAELRSV